MNIQGEMEETQNQTIKLKPKKTSANPKNPNDVTVVKKKTKKQVKFDPLPPSPPLSQEKDDNIAEYIENVDVDIPIPIEIESKREFVTDAAIENAATEALLENQIIEKYTIDTNVNIDDKEIVEENKDELDDEQYDEDKEDEDEEVGIITDANTRNILEDEAEADVGSDTNDDESSSDSEDESYLQKFQKELNVKYLEKNHPECVRHNHSEVLVMTQVVRDEYKIIIDSLHRTLPYLTKYEKARVIGQRAKQIDMGAQIFIEVDSKIIDGYIIAEMELMARKIPFIIRRPIPGGGSEYWNLKDLDII